MRQRLALLAQTARHGRFSVTPRLHSFSSSSAAKDAARRRLDALGGADSGPVVRRTQRAASSFPARETSADAASEMDSEALAAERRQALQVERYPWARPILVLCALLIGATTVTGVIIGSEDDQSKHPHDGLKDRKPGQF